MSKIMSDARQQQIGELKETIQNLEHSLNQARNSNLAHLQTIAELERRINLKDQQLQTSLRRHTQFRQRVTQLQAINATCRREIQRLTEAVESKKRQIDLASFGFAHSKQKITHLESQQISLKRQVDRLNQVVNQQKIQLKELKNQSSGKKMFQPKINKNLTIDQLINLPKKENQSLLANRRWTLNSKPGILNGVQEGFQLLLQQKSPMIGQQCKRCKVFFLHNKKLIDGYCPHCQIYRKKDY